MNSKVLLKIGAAVAFIACIAYAALDLSLGSFVSRGVNRFGPQITRTKVTLAGAHISPLTGSGALTGLFVGNPEGWRSEKAFYLGKIHVEIAPGSLFGDHVVVNEVEIDQPEFVYETRFVSSNIGELLQNIRGTASGGQTGPASAKNGKPIKFEIKHFHLTNGRVTVGVGRTAATIPMPPIELRNVGTSEGGITSSQLAAAIMRSMSGSIVQATTQAARKIGSTMGAAAGQSLKELLNRKPRDPSNP